MGESLSPDENELAANPSHKDAVEAWAMYIRAYRSGTNRQPDDPPSRMCEEYYLHARQLGAECEADTSQLLEAALSSVDGVIEVPHRLSEYKDELPDEIKERSIFH